MKVIIYKTIGIIGFILLIGIIGAADHERATLSQLTIISIISVILVTTSFFGLNLEEKRENNRRYKHGSRKNF